MSFLSGGFDSVRPMPSLLTADIFKAGFVSSKEGLTAVSVTRKRGECASEET